MPKKSLIKGIQYYSKTTKDNTKCVLCKRFIYSKNSYYSKNAPDELICSRCYTSLCSLENKNQMISTKIINIETPIYVGVKAAHICEGTSEILTECYGKFTYKNDNLTLPIKICKKCHKGFFSGKLYEKHKYELQQYTFINNRTGKPYFDATLSENYNSHIAIEKQAVEIPSSVQWAIKHPFQGGGCSGK